MGAVGGTGPGTPDGGPNATVIVPVRNGRNVVTLQLEALLREARAEDLEVLVVDDASRDGTGDVVAAWIRARGEPNFRLVRRSRRGGPNASRNHGARLARSDRLLFCDGDDVVGEGWAAALLDAWAEDAVLCGRLVGLEPTAPSGAWALPPEVCGVPYAYGGNMGIPRAVLERAGGFDEDIFAGGTEFEVAYRAQRELGVRVEVVPDAVVRYRLATDRRSLFVRTFRRTRGRRLLHLKLGLATLTAPTPRAWVRGWRRVGGLLVAGHDDPAKREEAVRRAGVLVGEAWWAAWIRHPVR